MTRKEELQQLNNFINKNGVTMLPPDERGPEIVISAWTKSTKKKQKKQKKN